MYVNFRKWEEGVEELIIKPSMAIKAEEVDGEVIIEEEVVEVGDEIMEKGEAGEIIVVEDMEEVMVMMNPTVTTAIATGAEVCTTHW